MSILKIKDSQGNWVGVPTVKGDKGNTGNGISSAILNDDYTLTLTFTDGTTYKTPSIRGEKGEKGEPATDMEIHICSASEYDAETRIPTIANPNDKTFYLVPTEDGTSPDLFTEWVYVNNAWEMFGSMKIDLSGYLTDVQINGESVVQNGIANIDLTGIDQNADDITDLKSGLNEVKEDLTRFETIIPILAGRGKTWAEIKQNVKMGYGEILYPVGTDFSVDCPAGAPYDSIVWTVVDHRVENGEHIMTLLMKHIIYGLQFDAPQAIIVPDETMTAGTYRFKLLSGYDTEHDGGKSVQFTLANDLAAGCQIVMNWPYNQTWIGKNITVYGEFGTTVIETCVMSEGTGGTDLGDADGTVSILNHTQRARYGSNNYKESAMLEWLNSDDLAGQWQTQQTRFQRPCSYATNRAGFVTYLDPEFVAVIREGTHLNRTNEVFDLNGKKQAYSTTEKFFLPSQEEIGFSSESGIVCGTVFDFYSGAAQSDKIKYDIAAQTIARSWWLRTPTPSTAYYERYVYSSGALSLNYAYFGTGASAACEI